VKGGGEGEGGRKDKRWKEKREDEDVCEIVAYALMT